MRVSRIPLPLAAALFLAAALALYAAGPHYPRVFDDYHLSQYQLGRHFAEGFSRSWCATPPWSRYPEEEPRHPGRSKMTTFLRRLT